MRTIKNSYFQAISKVTTNGKFPEYSDLWRCYHPTALMLDSDYCLFANSGRFEESSTTRRNDEAEGEAKTGRGFQKRLYVPVTRKVSPLERKKAANLKYKSTKTDRTKEQKKTFEYQQSMNHLYSLIHN